MFNGDVLNIFILVRGFGIIGGGAVLFSASALAGSQTILPLLGETFVIRMSTTEFCQNFTNFA